MPYIKHTCALGGTTDTFANVLAMTNFQHTEALKKKTSMIFLVVPMMSSGTSRWHPMVGELLDPFPKARFARRQRITIAPPRRDAVLCA